MLSKNDAFLHHLSTNVLSLRLYSSTVLCSILSNIIIVVVVIINIIENQFNNIIDIYSKSVIKSKIYFIYLNNLFQNIYPIYRIYLFITNKYMMFLLFILLFVFLIFYDCFSLLVILFNAVFNIYTLQFS